MKIKTPLIILSTMLITSLTIFASQQYKVFVHGKELKCKTIVQDNTVYVPVTDITKAMGFESTIKDGKVNITSASSVINPPITTTSSKPSVPQQVDSKYPLYKGYSTAPLTKDEIVAYAKKGVASWIGTGNCTSTELIKYEFEDDTTIRVEYKAVYHDREEFRIDKYSITRPANARAYIDNNVIDRHAGVYWVNTYTKVTELEIDHFGIEQFITDKNGNKVVNPEYIEFLNKKPSN